uniref:Translation initiation factor 5A C-terminal domain-containing protein n=1 Tax=Seriola lalandi dorsalis TaxID=1841481 RepID=A0A3B4X2K7_SERLL
MWLTVCVSSPSQLVNINESYMSLMSDNGDIREDLRVPESDIGKEIEAKFEAGDEFMVSVNGRGFDIIYTFLLL